MSRATRIRIAAVVVFTGIVLGAFGAHALEDLLTERGKEHIWETATLYHLIHGVALFVVAMAAARPLGYFWFLLGVFLFCGSLYTLALVDVANLGIVTPFGGVAFLLGWARWIFGRHTVPT